MSRDESGWDAMLLKLAAFNAEYGNCRVSLASDDDPKLAAWVAKQRHSKKSLDACMALGRMACTALGRMHGQPQSRAA